MRGKPHDDTTRAQVMAALLAGQGVGEIAAAYSLPESTVRAWAGSKFAEVRAKKEDEIGDLITAYLKEVLATLSVQARFFRDEAWLKRQPANEAAVLHGVLTDKAIRILAAAEPDPTTPGAEHVPVGTASGSADGGAGE